MERCEIEFDMILSGLESYLSTIDLYDKDDEENAFENAYIDAMEAAGNNSKNAKVRLKKNVYSKLIKEAKDELLKRIHDKTIDRKLKTTYSDILNKRNGKDITKWAWFIKRFNELSKDPNNCERGGTTKNTNNSSQQNRSNSTPKDTDEEDEDTSVEEDEENDKDEDDTKSSLQSNDDNEEDEDEDNDDDTTSTTTQRKNSGIKSATKSIWESISGWLKRIFGVNDEKELSSASPLTVSLPKGSRDPMEFINFLANQMDIIISENNRKGSNPDKIDEMLEAFKTNADKYFDQWNDARDRVTKDGSKIISFEIRPLNLKSKFAKITGKPLVATGKEMEILSAMTKNIGKWQKLIKLNSKVRSNISMNSAKKKAMLKAKNISEQRKSASEVLSNN